MANSVHYQLLDSAQVSLCLVLGVGIGVWLIRCHRRGWIELLSLGTFRRSSSPVWFWMWLTVYAAFAAFMVAVGIGMALGL